LDGQHVDGHVFTLGFGSGAGVARGNEDLLDALVLRHFPGQGVLAAAAADDQYVHVSLLVEAGLCPFGGQPWLSTPRICWASLRSTQPTSLLLAIYRAAMERVDARRGWLR